MKLLHLADLHLGKSVLEAPMLEEQKSLLQNVVHIAIEQSVDVVLISGDIYDRSVPPADAVEVLDAFLHTLHTAGKLVLAIAGNHDSPERLEFGSRIFAEQGIHIAGIYSGHVPLVKLEDSIGVVNLYLLPFVKPVNVRETLGVDVSNTDEAVCAALSSLPLCPDERNVLVAHQFVCAGEQAPETCDSETLSVGGSDQVNVSAFDGFDYVALGHLHRAQRIGRDTVRYAGSPLKYSLSEVTHVKSVSVVTLGKKGRGIG